MDPELNLTWCLYNLRKSSSHLQFKQRKTCFQRFFDSSMACPKEFLLIGLSIQGFGFHLFLKKYTVQLCPPGLFIQQEP